MDAATSSHSGNAPAADQHEPLGMSLAPSTGKGSQNAMLDSISLETG
jgi:hypothetical protein